MRVHHLNAGTLNPIYPPISAVCYCLLLETSAGLVLVDTGLGLLDYERPTWPVRVFMAGNRMGRDPDETAARQVTRLGYKPEDVRHIVMTHLHIDHAGGLPDFPGAVVHVHAREHAAAMRPTGWLAPLEYVPAHWAHRPRWALHDLADGAWFGFESLHVLDDVDGEVRLIPLPGHTAGHCGVAVRTGSRWTFLTGDEVYPFYNPEWLRRYGEPPPWLARLAGVGRHKGRLEALWREHGDEVMLIFSHDALRWAELQGQKGATVG